MTNAMLAFVTSVWAAKSAGHWFASLPPEKQEKVLAIAKDLSWELFKQFFTDLVGSQRENVLKLAKEKFVG